MWTSLLIINYIYLKCKKKSETPPERWSYQFPSQPSQCALYVQFSASLCSLAAFTEALGPARRIPACTLSCWFTVIKGGVLAGEVPQSGEDHFHHVRSVMSSVLFFSTLCGVVRRTRLWLQIQPRLLS